VNSSENLQLKDADTPVSLHLGTVLMSTLALMALHISTWVLHKGSELWATRIIELVLTIALAVLLGFTILRKERRFRAELLAEIQKRQETEERMRLALRASQMGFFDGDVVNNRHVWSEAAKTMLGLPPDYPEGFDTLLKAVHPDDREMMKQAIEEDLRINQEFVREYRVVWPDGSVHWIWAKGRADFDPTGRATRVTGVITDITERKHLEEQLRQAQKMEAVGRLAGGVAHDFNNALGVITGYGELLQSGLAPEDTRHRYAEEIGKAARRAASFTRQLLAFSRRQTIQPVVLDLNSVVADTDKMLRRLIGEDIDLTIIRDSKLKSVKADRGQIEQVLMNLAVNARDAMPQGGKLIIQTANTHLDECYLRQHPYAKVGPYVMLSVSDTGCGMDKETQAHIFEPFFTTKGPGEGTGLGLSTVYGIVKQSDGSISAYSEPGVGTTFRIYLPQIDAPAETTAVERTPQPLPSGSETILLVEDEDSLRGLARGCLSNRGYTILEAHDGASALQVARQHIGPIHLLLTDVIMPGMSGPELARTLIPSRSEMKLLYMSGYTQDLVTQHGVLDASTALIEKPFGIEALLKRVREVLGPAATSIATPSICLSSATTSASSATD